MSLTSNYPGIHHKDPWVLQPVTVVSASLMLYNSAGTQVAANTTSFFTGFAQTGIQDNTDWTLNTYKTIYSHTGSGLIYAMVACTAGGAETTTFEITIDGVKKEITVTNANTERALLVASGFADSSGPIDFTTANQEGKPLVSLDSSTLTTFQTGSLNIIPQRMAHILGAPAMRYDISCLVRMKHSASIVNATATSFSGVLVRKGIAA